jgi:hypothetical protein
MWLLVAVVFAVVSGFGGAEGAQSLADVALKEMERRKAVSEPAKVYTNEDVEKSTGPLTTGTSVKPQASGDTPGGAAGDAKSSGAKATPDASAQAGKAASADAGTADEAAWRDRMTAARQKLAKAEAFDRALQSQINGLWAEFTARDNPVERTKIEKDRGEAIAEQARVKGEAAAAKKEIADIAEEGRKAGVPAGWLR